MGLLSSVGGIINDLTGASSASSQQQKHNKRLMKIQTDYEREFAQNAHQREVEDLKKAGINPIHSAGGSGATADAAGASASGISAGQSPIDMIQGISSAKQMLSTAKANEADTKLKNAQTAESVAKTANIQNETGNGWAGKILGEEAGKAATEVLNTPIRHVKKKWNSAKAIKTNDKKKALKNILLGE